jgi:hypothetical protein
VVRGLKFLLGIDLAGQYGLHPHGASWTRSTGRQGREPSDAQALPRGDEHTRQAP